MVVKENPNRKENVNTILNAINFLEISRTWQFFKQNLVNNIAKTKMKNGRTSSAHECKITAQQIKFSIKDFFSKCDQIRWKLWIWSHLLKKFLIENFVFCAVNVTHSDFARERRNYSSQHSFYWKQFFFSKIAVRQIYFFDSDLINLLAQRECHAVKSEHLNKTKKTKRTLHATNSLKKYSSFTISELSTKLTYSHADWGIKT